MQKKNYQLIMFDLDGTLTDSAEGICNSAVYALAAFGISADKKELRKFVGPPLKDSFSEFYGFEGKDLDKAVEIYREYYAKKGVFENALFDGIDDLLKKLTAQGKTLALATSKPLVFTQTVLVHFGIDKYFSFLSCAESDSVRSTKREIVDFCLESLNADKQTTVMVGDRKFDVDAAWQSGVDSIGVLYGYGGRDELEKYHATYIVDTVSELGDLLLD